jgi:hypothetical protein
VTRRQAVRQVARGLVAMGMLAAIDAGCAERMGKRAAAGAVAEMRAQSKANPNEPQVQKTAAKAVEGAVTELASPAEVARIEHMVSEAASAAATTAVADATRQLMLELGADGEGPLAVSFARTGERVSAAAVGSLSSELLALAPECAGPDPLDCLEKRLQQTARATAASFSAGVRETLGWQLLLVAFGLGAGGGVLGAWLWSMRDVRRRSLRTA